MYTQASSEATAQGWQSLLPLSMWASQMALGRADRSISALRSFDLDRSTPGGRHKCVLLRC